MKPEENSEFRKKKKKMGGEGRGGKKTKTGKKGIRARKMQGSFFNQPELHPSFTFKSIV